MRSKNQPGDSTSDGEKSNGEQSSKEQSDGEQSSGESQDDGGSQTSDESQNSDNNESGNESQSGDDSQDGDASESGDTSERTENERSPSDESSGQWPSDESRTVDSQSATGGDQDNSPPPPRFHPPISLAPATSMLAALLKTAFYLVIAVVALVLLWRYRNEVLAAWRHFLDELREFWARLFGGRRDEDEGQDELARAAELGPRPFADFTDPFATGRADSLPPAELVRYSFAAFEAWARENGHARLPDETPHELAHNVSARQRAVSDDARRAARLYSQVAYAPDHLPQTDVDDLRQLWWQMSR